MTIYSNDRIAPFLWCLFYCSIPRPEQCHRRRCFRTSSKIRPRSSTTGQHSSRMRSRLSLPSPARPSRESVCGHEGESMVFVCFIRCCCLQSTSYGIPLLTEYLPHFQMALVKSLPLNTARKQYTHSGTCSIYCFIGKHCSLFNPFAPLQAQPSFFFKVTLSPTIFGPIFFPHSCNGPFSDLSDVVPNNDWFAG